MSAAKGWVDWRGFSGEGLYYWPLVTAAEMRELDRHTIETLGVAGEVLMESAGRAVAEVVLAQLSPGGGREATIVCGRGNNGGDGLVAARHLHQQGVPVRAVLLDDPETLAKEAAQNWTRAKRVGVAFEGADWVPPTGGVVVDAIFGTGLSRAVEGVAAVAIQRIESWRAATVAPVCVVAVDLPSGICADSGAILGAAVRADITLTLGLPKLGLALEPARSTAGRVWVARIGIADATLEFAARALLWTRSGVGSKLPSRPPGAHKGSFGHALIVAASEGKTGAAALAAEGAARVGSGLVTIACPAGLNDILEIKCTEAMTEPVPDTANRALASSAEEAVVALASTRDAVGMGPGVGRDRETQSLLGSLAKRLELPLVIDAEGLLPFAAEPGLLRARTAPTVLTPHPGEAAQLLGIEAAEVNRDRPAAARQIASQTGAVVALKGAATVTAAPDGRIAVNPTGGPALASGGTGDVLLGMVTGLVAQGVDAFEATALAVFVHGAAADAISQRMGTAGMLAGELAAALPTTLAALRAEAAAAPARELPSGLAVSFPEP